MEKQVLLEALRLILIAFVIAMVINFFRVLIFTDGNFIEAFFRTNNTNNEITNTQTIPIQQNESTRENLPNINTYYEEEIINIPLTQPKEFSI